LQNFNKKIIKERNLLEKKEKKNDCPDAVRTPPMFFFDGEIVNQTETSKQHDIATPGNSTSTPVQRTAQLPQALEDKSLHRGETMPNEATPKSQHLQEEDADATR